MKTPSHLPATFSQGPAALDPPPGPLSAATPTCKSDNGAARRSSLWAVVMGFAALLPAVFADKHAYTWSLLAFIVPLGFMIQWLRRHAPLAWNEVVAHGPATLAVLVPMGLALNLLLADVLFVYPEARSNLGVQIGVPAGPASVAIPIEEYLFYVLGFSFILIGYVFFAGRKHPGHSRATRSARCTAGMVAVPSLLALGAAAWLRPDESVSAPVYLYYLVALPLALTILFAARVRRFIDRTGLARITAFTVTLSIVMEALLALPRGWWGYNQALMCGVDVAPGLPLEAVLVWFLAAVATPTVFETFRGTGTRQRQEAILVPCQA
jgi:hypothetical protein